MTTYKLMSVAVLFVVYTSVSSKNTTDTPSLTSSGIPYPITQLGLGNDTNRLNKSPILCERVHRSIDEFPPDFFTEQQRHHGAIIFHLLVAFYGFLFITFVCHDYYLPSVFCICLDLGISPDVAGATFMAMATCTAELFVSVIGTFLTKSDLGVGTVVGSGVYNTLGVSACGGLVATQVITMDKWPLVRESSVYMISIGILAIIAIDNVVKWYEALIMLVMYFGYFLFLFTQGKLVTVVKKLKYKKALRPWTVFIEQIKQLFRSVLFCKKFTSDESQNITTRKNDTQTPLYGTAEYQTSAVTITPPIATSELDDNNRMNDSNTNEEFSSSPKLYDGNLLSIVWWTFCLPVTFTLSATIPDCRTNRKLYPYTFVMSIVWVSVITYILAWMLTICGDTFHISDIVMGIGVLAVGNSIPEVVSGIINAQNGEGSMSISSALGSNTMDILLCLGLPWFVKCLLPASMGGGPVMMETDSLFFNCVCMAASVVILNVAAALSGFKMHRPFGFMCLVGQIIVIVLLILNGLNAAKNRTTGVEQCQ